MSNEITWEWLDLHNAIFKTSQAYIYPEPMTRDVFIECSDIIMYKVLNALGLMEEFKQIEFNPCSNPRKEVAGVIWDLIHKHKKTLVDKIVESCL